ncbi:hypothetical protein [Cedecea sp. NFIX57]|uniref:hypothetical protein n=1 Tax=Cedecea sp. NFIX57 TaxID=1566286 RepID=UPI000A0D4247|nr:hypothetical protein [Cedecea sp. NFIX57]SMG61751.1 hypothetical protein SAMN03159353_105717 [Cedecea sp. NFIX57]
MSIQNESLLTAMAVKTVLSYVIAVLNEDQQQILKKLTEKSTMNFDELASDTVSKEEIREAANYVNDMIREIVKTGLGEE